MDSRNNRIEILGVEIDNLDTLQTIERVRGYVDRNEFLHLIGVNADKILNCIDSTDMKNIVNDCEIINADGASVILASKLLGKKLPERVAGIDLMQDLLVDAEKNQHTVYFLGAKQIIVEKTVAVLSKRHPDLKIVGFRNGYLKKDDWYLISNELKKISPDYVFVGITSPLKEELIEFFRLSGNTGVFMGVGGSFDVISGEISRAPQFLQILNLEWLFRVYQEPKRLFKRYFIGNIRFIKLVIFEKIKIIGSIK